MENVKKLVENLMNIKDEAEQIKQLQIIGDCLLRKRMKIADVVIEPLWIEAYYFVKGFEDSSVHGCEEQKNNFCKLYFHHKTGDRRSGVDLCLSCGDYCLSFLLKYTLVNGNFTTQSKLHNEIYDAYKENQQIQFLENNTNSLIVHTRRIGISSGNFKNADLACVKDINKIFTDRKGTRRSLPNKTNILKQYIFDHYSVEKMTEEEKKQASKMLVGEYWKSLFK